MDGGFSFPTQRLERRVETEEMDMRKDGKTTRDEIVVE